jgi:type VI secretion system protein ImpH
MSATEPSRRAQLRETPERFGFFALLREMERANPDKPRIGRGVTLGEEVVTLGQDPFLHFPDSNISQYEEADGRPPRVRARFLGYFGPQGPLPLHTTVEAHQWFLNGDDAFVRFTDMITGRFQQLFFRAWSNARGITQFDHEGDDRFQTYVGAFTGKASPALCDRGEVADIARLPFEGLAATRIKSPVRLRQMLEQVLGVEIRIREHMPLWMTFEESDQSRIGEQGSTLGRDCRLGARVQSVNEKILLTVRTESRAEYESFLPGGTNFERLTDLLFCYLGPATDVDIALELPAKQVTGARLGGTGEGSGRGAALGWTAWMAPPPQDEGTYLGEAVFSASRRPAKAVA